MTSSSRCWSGSRDPRDVEQVAEKLLSALRRPFNVKGYDLVVGGTIGIAIASPELRTPKDLLRAADVALYRAKAAGGGVFALFDPGVDRQGLERLEQEADLRRATGAGRVPHRLSTDRRHRVAKHPGGRGAAPLGPSRARIAPSRGVHSAGG